MLCLLAISANQGQSTLMTDIVNSMKNQKSIHFEFLFKINGSLLIFVRLQLQGQPINIKNHRFTSLC